MEFDEQAGYERDMAEMEYFTRCHEVECLACKIQHKATEFILRQSGWHLSEKGEFCVLHADYPTHHQLIDQSQQQRGAANEKGFPNGQAGKPFANPQTVTKGDHNEKEYYENHSR